MTINERRLAAMIAFAAMVLIEACSSSRAPALEMRGNQGVKPAPSPPSPPSAGSGVLERFRALKAQHDSGQLSDTEYETKRQQLSDEVMQGK